MSTLAPNTVSARRAAVAERLAALAETNDHAPARLRKVTEAFLASPFFESAVLAGWTDLELFGVAWAAPMVRVGDQGLVAGLALSSLAGPKLKSIAADHAVIRCSSGSELVHRRFPAVCSVLWWEHPLLGVSRAVELAA